MTNDWLVRLEVVKMEDGFVVMMPVVNSRSDGDVLDKFLSLVLGYNIKKKKHSFLFITFRAKNVHSRLFFLHLFLVRGLDLCLDCNR